MQSKLFMHENKAVKPTDSELEILQILWEKGDATVRQVHVEMLEKKDVGYTTTLKLMQIMHEKGLVERDESSRTHIYWAAINKLNTQNFLLNKMIHGLFGGSSGQLIMQALGNHKVSKTELEKIQSLINSMKDR